MEDMPKESPKPEAIFAALKKIEIVSMINVIAKSGGCG
jgi:hypothetical protein